MRKLALPAVLLVLLPLSARAALSPVGAPFPIEAESSCSFLKELTVISNPAGSFEVVWVDDPEGDVRGQLFNPDTSPAGGPVSLLTLHGGQVGFGFVGTWADGYQVAMNVIDTGVSPSNPWEAFRVRIDPFGNLLVPPLRIKTPNFREIAPAGGGESMELRVEPPVTGTPSCSNRGLLVRRLGDDGVPVTSASRVTRRASAWSGADLVVERVVNDTFLVAYRTCEQFSGYVARRLNQNGLPVGKPINFPLPGPAVNFGGGNVAMAARGRDFLIAAMAYNQTTGAGSARVMGVFREKKFGPTRLPIALAGGIVDVAASPTPGGGYVLLYFAATGDPLHATLFAQELSSTGAPQGAPVQLTGDDFIGVDAAVASLPGGRWIVVTRAQQGDLVACDERLIGTIFSSGS